MKLLTPNEEQEIIEAIKNSEKLTSGEIKLHIENKCNEDPIERAIKVFDSLKMSKTKERNGVLFYVAVESKKFAIIGDKGINEKVGEDFWEKTKELMQKHFLNRDFAKGIIEGVKMAGEQLMSHFPYDGKNDTNELSDEISFGK